MERGRTVVGKEVLVHSFMSPVKVGTSSRDSLPAPVILATWRAARPIGLDRMGAGSARFPRRGQQQLANRWHGVTKVAGRHATAA